MGLEPTTFCMASASDVRTHSRLFARIAWFQRFQSGERTRAHPTERGTLPFSPRPSSDAAQAATPSSGEAPRREVGAAGPNDRVRFRVDLDPRESPGVSVSANTGPRMRPTATSPITPSANVDPGPPRWPNARLDRSRPPRPS